MFKSGNALVLKLCQHKKSRNNNSNQNGGHMHGYIVFYGRFPNSLEPDHPVQDSNPCSWATTRNNTTGLWEPALSKYWKEKDYLKGSSNKQIEKQFIGHHS